ncbi:MAG: DUF4139 domain-containing protein [Deltaproteobacteria bacterium]|nr:DUF4139 domain-containing protein [Deltaproteobacteria bacterium]
MKMKYFILPLLVFFVLTGTASGQTTLKSLARDQIGVKVTVYNNNLGLIKDTRRVHLAKGRGELRFMDVAAHIMPVTVHAKSLNLPRAFSILEQNYEYDLMNANKLLDKYVGQKIKLIDWNKYQDRKEIVDAVLLSNNNGQIYKIGDEIYLGHPGYKVLPRLPEDLIAKPTLTWLYENASEKPHQLEVSYLTNNINWKADYILMLNQDDSAADLSGWVTLDNKSGATYKDAELKLVAGQVHRVEPRVFEDRVYATMRREKAVGAPQFQEKSFFEYHIYKLERKTTIKDNQTKQVSLLKAGGVKINKELLVYGLTSYFTRQYQASIPKQPVSVYVKFKNAKDNNLGMPLPAGIMRLYKQDEDGSQEFIGEDKIKHTPKDEEVRLKIGEAFDVVAERVQTDYRRVTSRLHESEWRITLRNHKEKEVSIGVIEPLYGNWRVLSSSQRFQKIDAFTIRFDVKVPADGEVKINYRIQVGL